MARDFDGSTDRIDYANVFNPNSPASAFTCAGWVWLDTNTSSQYFLTVHNSGDTGAKCTAYSQGNSQTGACSIWRDWSSGYADRDRYGSGNLSTGTWNHFHIESDSGAQGSGMECWVNGALPGSASSTNGSGSLDSAGGSWSLGGRIYSDTRNVDGRLAEIGVWDRLLTADERNALAKGFSPLHFRRGLRFYVPLIGRKDVDRVGGKTPTYDGTSVIEHPRIIYPG